MLQEKVTEHFYALKPLCDRVMKNPSPNLLSELQSAVNKIGAEELQILQSYITFPLEVHLRANRSQQDLKKCIVDCLREIIRVTQMDAFNTFARLFTLIFHILYDKADNNVALSEELKLSLVKCASELISRCTPFVKSEIYKRDNIHWLSQGVYVCTRLQQHEKLRPLRVAALECLLLLNQTHDSCQSCSPEFRQQVAEVFVPMFPGILAALQYTIMGDLKQGHLVTLTALQAWSRLIALVLEDEIDDEDPENPYDRLMRVANRKTEEFRVDDEILKMPMLTSTWKKAAAAKVVAPVKDAEVLQGHEHWKVRYTLVEACLLLLEKCARTLSAAVPSLVDVLIVLTEDEDANVASKSRVALDAFSKTLSTGGGSVLQMIEESLFSLVKKLPSLLNCTENEAKQLSALHLLSGYFRILGPCNLQRIIRCTAQTQGIINALLEGAAIETSAVSLLEDCSLRDSDNFGDRKAWRNLRNFFSLKVANALLQVCQLLGKYSDLNVLTEELLSKVPEHREAIFILNMVMSGVDENRLGTWAVIRNILDTYLDPETWYVPLVAENEVTLGQAQGNMIKACLLVEGVGSMASKVLPEYKPQYLLRILYPVLERAGSVHTTLAEAGLEAAKAISAGSISSLIWDNADYIAFHVTRNLRLLERQQGALAVLNVMLRYSSLERMPQLRDIVSDVVMQKCEDDRATGHLQVMAAFVSCVRLWILQREASKPPATEPESSLSVVEELLLYHRNKVEATSFGSDKESLSLEEIGEKFESEKVPEEVQEHTEDPPKAAELPTHLAVVAKVLGRCLYFLPRARHRGQQLLAIETLIDGCVCLSGWPDQLLPIVHKIWGTLEGRFSQSEPLIVNRSFQLLCTLADVSKDFIRSRTLKKVFSPLIDFLTSSAKGSLKQDSGSAYRYTQRYKLQLALLTGLGDLAVNLALHVENLLALLNACTVYLGSWQPQPLQASCVKLFKTIASYNADVVWFVTVSKWSPETNLKPPMPELEPIKVSGSSASDSEYAKNAMGILEFLEEIDQ